MVIKKLIRKIHKKGEREEKVLIIKYLDQENYHRVLRISERNERVRKKKKKRLTY